MESLITYCLNAGLSPLSSPACLYALNSSVNAVIIGVTVFWRLEEESYRRRRYCPRATATDPRTQRPLAFRYLPSSMMTRLPMATPTVTKHSGWSDVNRALQKNSLPSLASRSHWAIVRQRSNIAPASSIMSLFLSQSYLRPPIYPKMKISLSFGNSSGFVVRNSTLSCLVTGHMPLWWTLTLPSIIACLHNSIRWRFLCPLTSLLAPCTGNGKINIGRPFAYLVYIYLCLARKELAGAMSAFFYIHS